MLLAAAVTAVSCRSVVNGISPDPVTARATADGLFGGIATRFDNIEFEPRARTARRLIVKNFLTPSRIFRDTNAWSAMPNKTEREMIWTGRADPGRFHFSLERATAPLAHSGETRHAFRLRSSNNDEYEWTETADFAIGAATPEAMSALFTAWISSGERSDSTAVRADMHASFPHSVREWSQVFSFARTESSRGADGAWTQTHTIVLHPKSAEKTYPKFSKWLKDYVSPLRVRIRLRDSTHTWFDATVRNESLVVRMRTRDGKMLPLEGGDKPRPDTLTIESDFSAKLSIFRVGFRALRGQFIFVRDASQRGWTMTFTKEPDWQLPLLTKQMLRTPLRRPFAGTGSLYRVGFVRDARGSQNLLVRHVNVPVQESAILRFLSKLANLGINSYVDGAEKEMQQWLTASFGALRDDTRAILQTRTPAR